MKDPLISIIMPVFNSAQYIEESINSVLAQNYPHFELLIVNDGSLDDSETRVLNFSDSRIKYFSQENHGVSAARNVGLNRMKGDFFCFLDSDDVMPSGSLEERLKVFSSEKIDFVDGKVLDIDKNGGLIGTEYRPDFRGEPLPLLLKMDRRCFFGPSWMIRRRHDKEYYFDIQMKYCEDLEFYIRIASTQKGEYSYTEEPVLNYRRTNSSAMSNLQGLAVGYKFFIKKLKGLGLLSLSNELYLRYKISRIMFLSYLIGEKKVIDAFKIVGKYWR